MVQKVNEYDQEMSQSHTEDQHMVPRGRVKEHLKPHHSKKADTIILAPKRIERFLTVMQLNAMNGLFSFFLPNDTVETCQLFDRAICQSDLTIVYMLK